MDLSTLDKIELLKAAVKTTDKDLAAWLVRIVDDLDALPEGRRNIVCPPYVPHASGICPTHVPPAEARTNGEYVLTQTPLQAATHPAAT